MRVVVAKAADIAPGSSRMVRAAGREIAVFNAKGRFYAIQNRCPHEGASLCQGRLVGLAASARPGTYTLTRNQEFVRCPWHGWEFDITTGQSHCDPDRVRVRSYPAQIVATDQPEPGPYAAETYSVSVKGGHVMLDIGAADTIGAVVARRAVHGRVAILDLAAAPGTTLPAFTAGAHVDVHLAPSLVRQYSLCGDPADAAAYRIAVMGSDRSRGGSSAAHELRLGQPVRISRPRNTFPLDETAGMSVLIGGGIGITPLMAMAYRLARLKAGFVLHYAACGRGAAPFLDELRAGPVGPHLRTYIAGEPGQGRLDARGALSEHPDAPVYACGPDRLITDVVAAAAGGPHDRLRVELFSASVDRVGHPVRVTAARSGLTVDVPGDRTISDVLAEHGVYVPVSCEQGLCGSCLVEVLDGVPEHRDRFQSDAEKAAGHRMTACCSRACTPTLVLDL